MPGQEEDLPLPTDVAVAGVRAADMASTAGVVEPGSHDLAGAILLTQVLGSAHFVDSRASPVPMSMSLEVELVEEPGSKRFDAWSERLSW